LHARATAGVVEALAGQRQLMVGLYNFNPVHPWLESAWFQPLRN
jgi:hypothetical protein